MQRTSLPLLVLAWSLAPWCRAQCPTPMASCGKEKAPATKCCSSYLGISCYHPPPPGPCECTPDTGWHCWLPWYDAKTRRLLDKLHDCHYRCRAEAAKKLGSRLNTDVHYHPEVAGALLASLQCDGCWVVRKQAAWAIAYQGLHDQTAWTSLFLAARLDPHYLVRDAAT